MAARMAVIWSVLALVAVCSAASSAAAPAVDCSSLVLNMADCLTFVTAGSTAKKPEGTCCSGLKTVLKTDAECLCEAFRNSAQLGVTLNVTKAMTLPSACHVSAPSVSNCGLSNGTGSPAPVSTGTGSAPPVSTGTGSAPPVSTGTGSAPPAMPPTAVSPSSVAEPPSTATAGIGANEVSPAPAPGATISGASSLVASIGLLLVFAASSFTLF